MQRLLVLNKSVGTPHRRKRRREGGEREGARVDEGRRIEEGGRVERKGEERGRSGERRRRGKREE